jgi:hypothetical protein
MVVVIVVVAAVANIVTVIVCYSVISNAAVTARVLQM